MRVIANETKKNTRNTHDEVNDMGTWKPKIILSLVRELRQKYPPTYELSVLLVQVQIFLDHSSRHNSNLKSPFPYGTKLKRPSSTS